jgi:agmatinase
VAILGAPFDGGATFRPGARFGPRAIRLGEDAPGPSARPHMELGVDPFEVLDVVDAGDSDVAPADLDRSHALLRVHVARILGHGAIPIVLGGDHSLAAPMLEALASRHGADGFAVLHFDTHADTAASEFGVENSNGTPFFHAIRRGHLRGEHLVQLGLRGAWPSRAEFDWMREQGIRWRTMEQIDAQGLDAVVGEALAYANARAGLLYLTLDVDVLDPAFAPGTGTPEPGGLTTRELLRSVRRIAAEAALCAMDVVEVSPPHDPSGITATAAHRVVLEALSGIALRRSGAEARAQRSEPLSA